MNVQVNEPLLNGNEEKYLIECVRTGWISSEGPFVTKFENDFSQYVGRKYGAAVCNGSVAIDLAITALGIGQGDEVILPAHTIISCPAAVFRAGAKPVLVDCDPHTYNMKAEHIENKITSATKAIMVVHIFGLPVDMDPILDLARKYDLKVIEDAAEMHGQTYKGRPCGSFGDISTFSFYPNKIITTGEGGMVLTNDASIDAKVRSLRNLCFKPEQRFIHDDLGWNFRITNMQAALGVAQLENIDTFVAKKRYIGRKYNEAFSKVSGLQIPIDKTDYSENIYWVYPLLLDSKLGMDAKEFAKELSEVGVGTRPFFWPISRQPVFNREGLFINESYPNAEYIAQMGFYLPSGMAITDEQINYVIKQVLAVLAKYKK